METLDIGQKLIELGFAKASVPQKIQKNTIESQLAPILLSAEQYAKNYRNGIWSDSMPPLPVYVVYWRKGSQLLATLVLLTVSKLVDFVKLASRSAFVGVKYLALRPLRSRKPVQVS